MFIYMFSIQLYSDYFPTFSILLFSDREFMILFFTIESLNILYHIFF